MTVENLVLAIVLGGLFGWLLGKLPDKVVYGVAAVAIVAAVVLLNR